MVGLGTAILIRNHTVKNRIVLPPLVICGLHRDGEVNDDVVRHYERFASGGCGTVVVEATCVLPEGRLAGEQLGLWEDGQTEGMRRIAGAVRPHGALLLLQIHYASKQGEPDNVTQVGPSACADGEGQRRALTTAEVERIRDGFVAAAVRAEKAGFHGVELHGAHGYLLCAFMNPSYNRRDDRYGHPTALVREIITGIRQSTGNGFILTARVGADNPGLSDGIANCRALESAGLDMLSVSSGMGRPNGMCPAGELPVPADFPFSALAWRGCEIKKHVGIPVIAVGGLHVPALARRLVEEGWADFAAVGRGQLADPAWARKALEGEPVISCLDCKAGCRWFREHERCPVRKPRGTP